MDNRSVLHPRTVIVFDDVEELLLLHRVLQEAPICEETPRISRLDELVVTAIRRLAPKLVKN